VQDRVGGILVLLHIVILIWMGTGQILASEYGSVGQAYHLKRKKIT
jgi:hypothetical protein